MICGDNYRFKRKSFAHTKAAPTNLWHMNTEKDTLSSSLRLKGKKF